MAVKLVEAALPKSASGRKGTPIDLETADALVTALTQSASVGEGNAERPRTLGLPDAYPTKGKAGSVARKYADYVSEKMGVKIRVNVYSEAKDTAPFHWRIYRPLKDYTLDTEDIEA